MSSWWNLGSQAESGACKESCLPSNKEKGSTEEFMLIFSQKSWSSKEDVLAHLKHMYWEHIRRRVVKSLHPGGVLLQHWVGSVQDRGAAAFQSHIKVPVLCITRNAAFPPWEQHCQHGADPSQSASLTSWALTEAAHWKHILPLPLQHCRAVGGGERSAVGSTTSPRQREQDPECSEAGRQRTEASRSRELPACWPQNRRATWGVNTGLTRQIAQHFSSVPGGCTPVTSQRVRRREG